MTAKKTSRPEFNRSAVPTHALVLNDPSFPKGAVPIGTTAELATLYERLLTEHTKGMSAMAMKVAIPAFEAEVELYKLEKLPSSGAKGGLLGTGLNVPNVNVDKGKIIESIDNFDTKKLGEGLKDLAMDGAALWISKFNPVLWGKMAKRVNTVRKVGTDAASTAISAAKDFYGQMTENMTGDAFMRNGTPYVKRAWLEKEGNATLLPNLDALTAPAPKPRRGGGSKPKP